MSTSTFNTIIKPTKPTSHPFHIVDPSPWPILAAFSAFFRVLGLTLHRHSYLIGINLFYTGFAAVLCNATFWWRDVVREATFEGHHTKRVRGGLRFGRLLFIVSEIRLFFAFFWAYFHASLNPSYSMGGVWPPVGIEARNPWLMPLLNTILLLTSGAALTWSHFSLLQGDKRETINSLIVTIILATFFTLFQAYEYLNAPFARADGVYGSTFYRLTGLHGFHVFVGTIFLGVALYRTVVNHFTRNVHVGYECAAWYWHFVDVVWIFLFLVVYIWGR